MPRFSLNMSPSVVAYIERCATKAINCLTQKESLDAADIQAISEMLKLAVFPYNEFVVPKKNFLERCKTQIKNSKLNSMQK